MECEILNTDEPLWHESKKKIYSQQTKPASQ